MAITPDYEEFETDEAEEIEEEEETSTTWILNESSKTIGALSEEREECIVQSAKCALRTEQQEYEIYPIDYGSRLHEMPGDTKPHVYAEIEGAIRECLDFDDRISSVGGFRFEDHGDDVAVTFDMEVNNETVQMEEEVSVDG